VPNYSAFRKRNLGKGINITPHRFEIARVLMRFDHVVRFIINANQGITRAAEKPCAFADAANVYTSH
jgi:hypothetical protein